MHDTCACNDWGTKELQIKSTHFTFRQCNSGWNAHTHTHSAHTLFRYEDAGTVVRDKLTSHYSKQTKVRSNAKTTNLTLSGKDSKTNHSLTAMRFKKNAPGLYLLTVSQVFYKQQRNCLMNTPIDYNGKLQLTTSEIWTGVLLLLLWEMFYSKRAHSWRKHCTGSLVFTDLFRPGDFCLWIAWEGETRVCCPRQQYLTIVYIYILCY